MHFFINLFLVKIRLEIMFNNVVDRKKTCFGHKKFNLSTVPKIVFFQRGQPILLVKKGSFFLYLFSVKIRIKIMFNHFFDNKKENRPFNDLNSDVARFTTHVQTSFFF